MEGSRQIQLPNEPTIRNESEERAKKLHKEIGNRIQEFGDSLQNLVENIGKDQDTRSRQFANELASILKCIFRQSNGSIKKISNSNEGRQKELHPH